MTDIDRYEPPSDIARLFEPTRIGALQLRNRVFISGHTTNLGEANTPTQRHVAYHRARARGGVGLIISEGVRVHPTSAARSAALGAFTPDCIERYAPLPAAVQAEGGRMFAQLLHLGRQAAGDYARTAAWAPSPIPWKAGAAVPHQMDTDDIATIVNAFATAGRWMLDAGFDGLEVHLGHGHLIQQFLSPVVNQRTDAYGGSDEARLRFARETLHQVFSAAAGRGEIGIRISADEFLPGGLDVDRMLPIVGTLLEEFPLSFVHVSHSAYVGAYSLATQMADMSFPTGAFRSFPKRFKQAFPETTVLAICRLDDVEEAAEVLAEGEADLVGMTRAHIADPDLLTKAVTGQRERVRSCIACNQGCIGRIEQNLPMSCVVNPRVGLEDEWDRLEGEQSRGSQRILVIGGGPAGLTAAATAAGAGHEVTVLERRNVLGGAITTASALAGRSRFALLTTELERDVRALGVRVETGTEADVGLVLGGEFDGVIVATGAREQPGVFPGVTRAYSVEQAVHAGDQLGPNVLVYDEDGAWPGAGIAEHLATTGRCVHLVSPLGVAPAVTTYSRLALVRRLADLSVRTHPGRVLVGVEAGSAIIADAVSGATSELPGITDVVHAAPRVVNLSGLAGLTAAGYTGRVEIVGDAYAPRTALEAVYEGRVAATAIALRTPGDSLTVASPRYASGGTPFHL